MAVTELTPTAITQGVTEAVVTQGAGEAVNTSNTVEIKYPKNGKLLLWLDSDHASTAAIIAKGNTGVNIDKGAYTWAVGNAAAEMFIPESDRHLITKGDGSSDWRGIIRISWAANSAGYLKAFYLP